MKIPMTRTYYVRVGGRWYIREQETETINEEQAERVLANTAQPFEKSHRRWRTQHNHNHPFDHYQTVFENGLEKCVFFVDWGAATND